MFDLTKYKSKAGAAKALHRELVKIATSLDQRRQAVRIWTPAETEAQGYGRCWRVSWEEGPYEWGIALSGGASIWGSERGYPSGLKPEFKTDNPNWYLEPYYGFDVCFSS